MSILELNDWHIKRFLAFFAGIQILVLCLAVLSSLGCKIPFITQIAGLIYAFFIPGVMVLRMLRLHRLGVVKATLYSLGISVVFLMFLGLAANTFLPLIGIHNPLAQLPIVITSTIVLSCLCVVAYIRDRRYVPSAQFKWELPLSPSVLGLVLLPCLAVIGAQLVNSYQSNLLLMVLMVLLASVPILLVFTHIFPERLYGLAIWVIALSLLLHRSLISQYLWGADIIGEYAAFRTVEMNALWAPNSPNLITAYNVTLSVTILPVMLSKLMNLDGLWLFKLIFPVLLSFVPLAVYEMLKGQFQPKTAFLSSFLAMSLYTFYTTFLGVGKQLIAVLLLALFALVMLDKEIQPSKRSLLLGGLGVGVIVSHYSSAFLLAIIVFAAATGLLVLRRKSKSLTIPMAIFLVFVSLSWYCFQANGAVIKQFLGMGESAVNVQTTGVAIGDAGTTNEAQRLLSEGSGNMPDSMRYLYIFSQVLIVVGFTMKGWRWLRRKETKISGEFMCFSFAFLFLLALELVMPQFAQVVSLDRIYFVCMLFLSPFFIIGIEKIISIIKAVTADETFNRRVKRMLTNLSVSVINHSVVIVAALFAAIFLLFNTGFIYELAGQPLATSIALSRDNSDFPVFSEAEFSSGRWLLSRNSAPNEIYYDTIPFHLFANLDASGDKITGKTAGHIIYRDPAGDTVVSDIPANSFIYLREYNLKESRIALGWPSYQTMDIRRLDINDLGVFTYALQSSDVVYTNGKSEILYTLHKYSTQKD